MATAETDRGFGLGLALGLLTLGAAAYTLAAPTQQLTAWGFAAAVTLATLSVAAIHAYW